MKRKASAPFDIDNTTENEDWIKHVGDPEKAKGLTPDGKVSARGQPLPEWPAGVPVPITADDVARAMRKWDRDMPPEFRGLLMAEPEGVEA